MIQQAKRPSHWTTPEGMKYLGPHDSNEPMDVTVVLRRRSQAAPTPAQWPQTPRLTRAQFAEQHGADPTDIENLRGFAHQHGLTETGCDQQRRVLHLRGTPTALDRRSGYRSAPTRWTVASLSVAAMHPRCRRKRSRCWGWIGVPWPVRISACRARNQRPRIHRCSSDSCTPSPAARMAAGRPSASSNWVAAIPAATSANIFRAWASATRRRWSPSPSPADRTSRVAAMPTSRWRWISKWRARWRRARPCGVFRAEHRSGFL